MVILPFSSIFSLFDFQHIGAHHLSAIPDSALPIAFQCRKKSVCGMPFPISTCIFALSLSYILLEYNIIVFLFVKFNRIPFMGLTFKLPEILLPGGGDENARCLSIVYICLRVCVCV